jgi:hypothetical protein
MRDFDLRGLSPEYRILTGIGICAFALAMSALTR